MITSVTLQGINIQGSFRIERCVWQERFNGWNKGIVSIGCARFQDTCKFLGSQCSLHVTWDGGQKIFSGVIAGSEHMCEDRVTKQNALPLYRYCIEVRPQGYTMSMMRKNRYFCGMTTRDMIAALCQEAKTPIAWASSGVGMTTHTNKAQYQESHRSCLERLCYEHGIGWWIDYTKKNDTITFFDEHTRPHGMHKKRRMMAVGRGFSYKDFAHTIRHFSYKNRMHPQGVHMHHYDHEQPEKHIQQTYKKEGALDLYHIPPLCEGMARRFYDHQVLPMHEASFEGYDLDLALADRVSIDGLDDDYDVCVLTHEITKETQTYAYKHTARLRRLHGAFEYDDFPAIHQPYVRGVHSGVVVGFQDHSDPLYTKKEGMVNVRMHWHKDPQKNHICWARVSAAMAGSEYGWRWIPRIGHEVCVSFVDGHPDYPVVVGSLYNARNALWNKDKAALTGLKTALIDPEHKELGDGHQLLFYDRKPHVSMYVRSPGVMTWDCASTMAYRVEKGDINTTIGSGGYTLHLEAKDEEDSSDHTTILDKGHYTCHLKKGDMNTTLDEGNKVVELHKGHVEYKIPAGHVTYQAQSAALRTQKDYTVEVGSTQTFHVEDHMTMIIKQGDLTIKASRGAIHISGHDVVCKASGSMRFEGANVHIKALNALHMEGMTVDVKARTKAELSSGAQTSVSSSGITRLSGTLVKIQ